MGYENIPAYDDLIAIHKNFHDIARQYLIVCLDRSNSAAKRDTEADFRTVSDDVLVAIDHLSEAISQASRVHGRKEEQSDDNA